jgi:uncharacterized repeat protein (TIGR01451 family)
MMPADGRAASGHNWLRILAIAIGSLVLASCRSLSTTAIVAASAVTIADQAAAPPASPTDRGDFDRESFAVGSTAAVSTAPSHDASAVIPVGCETPCPPLPRLRRCGPRGGPCAANDCPGGSCPPQACVPPPPPPLIAPCLVCDGGDAHAPARPVGAAGIANLTAGDTVARYRAADDGPDADAACIAVANCACVFAPRFASVRELVRPLEDAAPDGPRGFVADELVGERVEQQPVFGSVQNLAPEAARKALPGVAIEERLGPLAVDQGELPNEDEGLVRPAAHVADDQPELARQEQRPLVAVRFEVPVAWTRVQGANVLSDGRTAQVVAADRGTATLRFECPGRAELTLCKRAGSDTARTGEELDFTIFLLNSGDRPLADIVLADALPARLELVPDSAASSLSADIATTEGDDGSVVLTWRLRETLPPGGTGFVRFRTIVR